MIGQNLEVSGVLALGEMPPPTGLKVTLTVEDPTKLLISNTDQEVGKKSIVIDVQPGETAVRYYLQALANSGTVYYSASAPGFRSRAAVVGLAPSGIILTPATKGPPDEAQVLRQDPSDGTHRFFANLSSPEPTKLVVWTAQLDPRTHRSADITVQPLRAGVSLELQLTNSHPEIAQIPTQLKIEPGANHVIAAVKPLSAGSTEITVVTPKGFMESANSTKVIGYIRK
jgi:hypothetical protein